MKLPIVGVTEDVRKSHGYLSQAVGDVSESVGELVEDAAHVFRSHQRHPWIQYVLGAWDISERAHTKLTPLHVPSGFPCQLKPHPRPAPPMTSFGPCYSYPLLKDDMLVWIR